MFPNETSHYSTSEDFQLFRDQPDRIRNQHKKGKKKKKKKKKKKTPLASCLGDFNFKDIGWPDRPRKVQGVPQSQAAANP